MRTVSHWIGGKPATGTSNRTGPVCNPATGEQQAEVLLARAADVDAAVRPPQGRVRVVVGSRRCRKRTKVLFAFRELVNARTKQLAEIVSDEHGKVLSDAAGEVQRGLEVIEFACGIPHAAQGRVLRPGLLRRRPVLLPPAARRVRRDHAVQLPGHGADVDVPGGHRLRQHVRAQAQRARPVGLAVRGRAVGRGRAARRRVQRGARRQGGRRRAARPPGRGRDLVRRLHPDREVHLRDGHSRTASGCRPWAGPRTTPSCCPTPTSTSPPTTSSPPRSARRASAAWPSRPPSPWAARPTSWSPRSARRPAPIKVGPGRDPDSEMGPVITAAARDRIVGLIGTGAEQGADLAVDGRGLTVAGHENGFFVGPTVIDQGHHRRWTSTARRSSARCCRWSAWTPSTTPSS